MKEYIKSGNINQEYRNKQKISGKHNSNDCLITDMLILQIEIESQSKRASENKVLFNELLYIAKRLKTDTKTGKMTKNNLKQLFLIANHYFLENSPVIPLHGLLLCKELNLTFIGRIINYPEFKDWITFRSYIKSNKTQILLDHKNKNCRETELYQIFIAELYRSNLIVLFPVTRNEIVKKSQMRNLVEFLGDMFD